MNELVIIHDEHAVTTSLKVAEAFGKNHQHVLRDIGNLLKEDVSNFGQMFFEGTDLDYYFRPRKIYYMNRDGFAFLVMGYTGQKAREFKLKYIAAFNEMEEQLKQPQLPTTPMQALELMFESLKENDEKLEAIDNRVVDLEENKHLSPGEYGYIGRLVNQRVKNVMRERHLVNLNSEQKKQLYHDLNADVKKIANVSTRTQLRVKHYEEVTEFIRNWEPSSATMTLLRQKADIA